jgi:hypothetical protein
LGDPGYSFDLISSRIIDLSYGFPNGGGPCEHHDASFTKHWNQDSIEVGGVYKLPHTRVSFVFVQGDPTVGPKHGMVWEAKLRDAGSPYVSERIIPGAAHTIETLPDGRAALEQALLSSAKG